MYDTFIENNTDPCGAIIVKDEVNHIHQHAPGVLREALYFFQFCWVQSW